MSMVGNGKTTCADCGAAGALVSPGLCARCSRPEAVPVCEWCGDGPVALDWEPESMCKACGERHHCPACGEMLHDSELDGGIHQRCR